ncbi:tripeptidyl-peptidase [Xylariomycetidae sp. FL0641]|nr:tripeptidyl-peptidase [Xylariomycetidae sp. FL0641]
MLSLVALLATAASAKVMDSLASVPKGWTELGPAALDEPIALKLAMPQQNAEALEKAVLEMSTPGHPNYGKHMGRLELRSYTAPTDQAVSSVVEWLAKKNIVAHVNNDWISFATDVGTANELLDTTFGWYQMDEGGNPKLRTLSYSVPDELAGNVDLIQPTTRFGHLGAKKSTIFDTQILGPHVVETEALVAGCNEAKVTPDCIKTLYNIKYTADPDGNLVSFGSYLEEYARYDDLDAFEQSYAPEASGQSFDVKLVNGGLNDQDSRSDSGEANLDVQYILGISNPVPIVEYSTGGRGPLVPTDDQPGPSSNEPYLEFLTYMLDLEDADLPQTMSTSYGEEEQSVPADYALKVCNMFMQLGARGVSILFSSGDSGPGGSCTREADDAPWFQPTFPAGCPYVTAVGGTHEFGPEAAVSFSSGGFSDLHPRPAWQEDAVAAYLESGSADAYADYFNASGRAIPDVAAQSALFAVVDQGRSALLSGTSASCPVFAGVVALLNAARKASGEAPLGFLNPWLYNQTAAFTDIVDGASSGCSGNPAFPDGAQWAAVKGWDPATGLGTPIFDELLEAAAPGTENA